MKENMKEMLVKSLMLICLSIGFESVSAGEYRDPPLPPVGGVAMPPTVIRGMHGCDEGHVMTGVRLDRNAFLCAPVFLGGNQDDAKRRIVTPGILVSLKGADVQACPVGMVMKGYRGDNNLLLCETAAVGEIFPDFPPGTVRGNMHACPINTVMVGLNKDTNVLACGNLGWF